jgi:HEAT repeat protein
MKSAKPPFEAEGFAQANYRARKAMALQLLENLSPQALPQVGLLLADPRYEIRLMGIQALAQIKTPAALEMLLGRIRLELNHREILRAILLAIIQDFGPTGISFLAAYWPKAEANSLLGLLDILETLETADLNPCLPILQTYLKGYHTQILQMNYAFVLENLMLGRLMRHPLPLLIRCHIRIMGRSDLTEQVVPFLARFYGDGRGIFDEDLLAAITAQGSPLAWDWLQARFKDKQALSRILATEVIVNFPLEQTRPFLWQTLAEQTVFEVRYAIMQVLSERGDVADYHRLLEAAALTDPSPPALSDVVSIPEVGSLEELLEEMHERLFG